MKKRFIVMIMNSKEVDIQNGWDTQSITQYKFTGEHYNWIFDDLQDAEDYIKHLLTLDEFKYNTFTIQPIYQFNMWGD